MRGWVPRTALPCHRQPAVAAVQAAPPSAPSPALPSRLTRATPLTANCQLPTACRVPGHEIVGVVTEVGANVTEFKVGGCSREEGCQRVQLHGDSGAARCALGMLAAIWATRLAAEPASCARPHRSRTAAPRAGGRPRRHRLHDQQLRLLRVLRCGRGAVLHRLVSGGGTSDCTACPAEEGRVVPVGLRWIPAGRAPCSPLVSPLHTPPNRHHKTAAAFSRTTAPTLTVPPPRAATQRTTSATRSELRLG